MKISHKVLKLSELTKKRERILLNPSWQRGAVWSRPKQTLLIDSILRGYDIPMIYLRKTPTGSAYDFEVVDGQQRLRAIWGFIDGEFALPRDLEKFGAVDASSKSFRDLTPRMRRQIEQVRLVTATVTDAREPEISRLFSRMQMGVRLNPAELRNAVQSPLRHAIDGVGRQHPFFTGSRIQRSRLRHQDYLAHAFSICFHDGAVDLKAPQLMKDYESITAATQYRPLMADLHEILDFLQAVNAGASHRLTQKWIFVDLVFLLFKHRKKLASIDPVGFAATYASFDGDRLESTSTPENLLAQPASKQNRELYSYIQNFKLSAGDKRSLMSRHAILIKRFSKDLS